MLSKTPSSCYWSKELGLVLRNQAKWRLSSQVPVTQYFYKYVSWRQYLPSFISPALSGNMLSYVESLVLYLRYMSDILHSASRAQCTTLVQVGDTQVATVFTALPTETIWQIPGEVVCLLPAVSIWIWLVTSFLMLAQFPYMNKQQVPSCQYMYRSFNCLFPKFSA